MELAAGQQSRPVIPHFLIPHVLHDLEKFWKSLHWLSDGLLTRYSLLLCHRWFYQLDVPPKLLLVLDWSDVGTRQDIFV